MKHIAFILLTISALVLPGYATKGGWPCWIWQKNTDQKENSWKPYQAATNQPTEPPVYISPQHKDAGMVLPAQPKSQFIVSAMSTNWHYDNTLAIQSTQDFKSWSTVASCIVTTAPMTLAWTDTTPRTACFYRAVNLP